MLRDTRAHERCCTGPGRRVPHAPDPDAGLPSRRSARPGHPRRGRPSSTRPGCRRCSTPRPRWPAPRRGAGPLPRRRPRPSRPPRGPTGLDVGTLALAARETANPVVGLVRGAHRAWWRGTPRTAAEYVHRGSPAGRLRHRRHAGGDPGPAADRGGPQGGGRRTRRPGGRPPGHRWMAARRPARARRGSRPAITVSRRSAARPASASATALRSATIAAGPGSPPASRRCRGRPGWWSRGARTPPPPATARPPPAVSACDQADDRVGRLPRGQRQRRARRAGPRGRAAVMAAAAVRGHGAAAGLGACQRGLGVEHRLQPRACRRPPPPRGCPPGRVRAAPVYPHAVMPADLFTRRLR